MAPEVGDRLPIVGARTVNAAPLLACPPTVTTTLPVVALAGTVTTIEVLLQLVIDVAGTPLNVTVLWYSTPLMYWISLEPKFVPVIVTEVPMAPEVGDRLPIVGTTVNVTPLLVCPPTVTTTFPVVAAAGTSATIEVLLQLVTAADTPLNITVLAPWAEPKFVPVSVTEVPMAPEVGDRLLIAKTANASPLLTCPP
jgi:hypothetical protein